MTLTDERIVAGGPGPEAPYCHAGHTHQDILRAWLFAAALSAFGGAAVFGPAAVRVIAVAVVAAMGADLVIALARGRPVIGGLSHAALTGLLLALTLPATVAWYIPFTGAVVAIVCGKTIFGGLGHYVWQPALVGRVVVQLLFLGSLSYGADRSLAPVLASGHLFTGSLAAADPVDMPAYAGWQEWAPRPLSDAIEMERPLQTLRRFAEGRFPTDGDLRYTVLLRDGLPPWPDTLFGLVPGGIGETSALAVMIAGLYLIYRGFLRWQLPVGILLAAFVTAAVLPVQTSVQEDAWDWFPIFAAENGYAVGLAYVLYHLTCGELMLGAFLLAGDMIATPMRARSQLIFALGVGAITIFMRLYGVLACECYWAILIMNSFVLSMDRRMKRPILGLATEPSPA